MAGFARNRRRAISPSFVFLHVMVYNAYTVGIISCYHRFALLTVKE
jgi:hypothetical protein